MVIETLKEPFRHGWALIERDHAPSTLAFAARGSAVGSG